MLYRAGQAAADVEPRADGLAGLSHLHAVGGEARVHGGPRGADGPAQQPGAFLEDLVVVRRGDGPAAGDDDRRLGEVHLVAGLAFDLDHPHLPGILYGGGKGLHGRFHRRLHGFDGVGPQGAKLHRTVQAQGGEGLAREMGLLHRSGGQVHRQGVAGQGQIAQGGQAREKIPPLDAGQAEQCIEAEVVHGGGQGGRRRIGTGGRIGAVYHHLDDFAGAVFAEGGRLGFRRAVQHQRDHRCLRLPDGSGQHAEVGLFDLARLGFNQHTDGSHNNLLK